MSAPWIIDGPMTRLVLEAFIETQLAPMLRKGDVVIVDKLANPQEREGRTVSEAAQSMVLQF